MVQSLLTIVELNDAHTYFDPHPDHTESEKDSPEKALGRGERKWSNLRNRLSPHPCAGGLRGDVPLGRGNWWEKSHLPLVKRDRMA